MRRIKGEWPGHSIMATIFVSLLLNSHRYGYRKVSSSLSALSGGFFMASKCSQLGQNSHFVYSGQATPLFYGNSAPANFPLRMLIKYTPGTQGHI